MSRLIESVPGKRPGTRSHNTADEVRSAFRLPEFLRKEAVPCAGLGEMYFAEKSGDYPRDIFRVCRSCPFRQPCLQWALDNDERWGVWGGLTPLQRARLTKGVVRGDLVICRECGQAKPTKARHMCENCYRRSTKNEAAA